AGFEKEAFYLTGPAFYSQEKLVADGRRFDLFFIDADKDNYENYVTACIKLANPGALIVTDNVLGGGSVV
ncbi:O-methyltransferase, partial [Lysinibacillus fusiformis]|uniref:O-methyltransferase n=1 Tax=Lysinibacillus fusiformis TaxID=28031 RepID=UPI003B97B691